MILRLFAGLSSADVPHPSLNDDQKFDWLRLIRSPNVGPVAFRFLINHFGGAKAALDALPELAQKGGAKKNPVCPAERIEQEMQLAAAHGLTLVAMGETAYPSALPHIEQAPPLLYVKGNPDILFQPMIALVGSRNASVVGRKIAQDMAQSLGHQDLIVASGLARGIDTAAHIGAVETGTVAVLAGGLTHIYPAENTDLSLEIIEKGGALISETHPGYKPRGQDFPRRNRIISGMSLGTVVIEAAIRSGSLITARMALEQDRMVMAVPGSPLDPRSQGGNKLIRDGATLVRDANDVAETITPMRGRDAQQSFGFEQAELDFTEEEFSSVLGDPPHMDERQRLVSNLSVNPVDFDTLARLSDIPVGTLQMGLLELELAGRLARHPGGRISLIPS